MAKILVVDDEPINVKMLNLLLKSEGYEVIEASNGRQALDLALKEDPDLILLDVMMPGMDGFEICRRLRAREATRTIPVVMVTALDTLEDKVQGIEAGADDFLTKPYNKIELLARSRSLLKMKSANDNLLQTYAHLTKLNAYADRLFGEFTPADFAWEDHLTDLLDQLLRAGRNEIEKPRAVFMAVGSFSDKVSGRIYHRADREVVAHPESVELPLSTFLAFSDQGRDVAFSNWQDVSESLEEYQDYFTPEVLKKVGPVENYTTYHRGQVAIVAYNYGQMVGPYDAEVLKALAAHSNFIKTVADQISEVEAAFQYTIEALARAAEANDNETGNHIRRVNAYSARLAKEMKLPGDFVREIAYSAQMHDVGKIYVHPDILRKPGRLDAADWEEIKRHTSYGANILGDHPRLGMARQIALHHHEKCDGSGYPSGLKGEEISLAGRIVAVADIYDALRCARAYKPAMTHQVTLDVFFNGDDRVGPHHFDPQVLEAFRRAEAAFAAIYHDLEDKEEG